MAVKSETNPLLSSQKTSDSSLQVILHPLVLLTISDYITRHTLRQQKGPLVGGLLGQQTGREITIEHAFECLLEEADGDIVLNTTWFEERCQQMRDVHQNPVLDLVGWYTVLPTTGPLSVHLPIHRQITTNYNESAVLLGFHPAAILEGAVGGKLPLTIYEGNNEAEDTPSDSGEDKEMSDAEPKLSLRFRELPFTVETGEAEMIGIDFVARGGGNATAVDTAVQKPETAAPSSLASKGKGKDTKKIEGKEADEQTVLSREDEELIVSLTAKANAIKMLHARINLISTYLQQLPPSYVSDTASGSIDEDGKKHIEVNHSILRSIQALLSHLTLLIPADRIAFEQELISEQNDVSLVNLLSSITESIKDIRGVGQKYKIVDSAKQSKKDNKWGDLGSGNGISGVGDLLG